MASPDTGVPPDAARRAPEDPAIPAPRSGPTGGAPVGATADPVDAAGAPFGATAVPVDAAGAPVGEAARGAAAGRRASTTGWRARVRRTPGGALALKAVVFVLGLAFVLLGCALVVAPGPLTIPPILLGLYLWSTEFSWADRLLDRAEAAGRAAWADARRRPVLSALVTVGGLVALGAGLWVIARYELLARALAVVGV